ncbi:hypothetical protein [Paracoccus sediminilitoris]|uniref:hypothetical protein n=1 Tax=Paracoccus sediminilitoris TaxID=2202419 RepID=UPI00272C18ED|nr:hypothetical protein [Paracoccus sediminilitoris]
MRGLQFIMTASNVQHLDGFAWPRDLPRADDRGAQFHLSAVMFRPKAIGSRRDGVVSGRNSDHRDLDLTGICRDQAGAARDCRFHRFKNASNSKASPVFSSLRCAVLRLGSFCSRSILTQLATDVTSSPCLIRIVSMTAGM